MNKAFLDERIWPRTDRTGECWEWQGARTKAGYGLIKLGPRHSLNLYVHRLVFEAFNGRIPEGAFICHRCDNPQCCRPEHLFLGDAKINNRDKASKGRAKGPCLGGERNPAAKLSEATVAEIRAALSEGKTGAEVARRFDVSRTTISSIKTGKTWS
jgi:hypothetical protein